MPASPAGAGPSRGRATVSRGGRIAQPGAAGPPLAIHEFASGEPHERIRLRESRKEGETKLLVEYSARRSPDGPLDWLQDSR